jgi:acyl carrier protein
MVFEKLKKIIVEEVGLDEEDITLEASFEDLGFDSLDEVTVQLQIEDEFDIEIPYDEAVKLKTVGDAVEYIQEHM